MPAYFTNGKTNYYNFDFQAYLESPAIKSSLGDLSFYKSWVSNWCDEFDTKDKELLELSRLNPPQNPLLERQAAEKRDVETYQSTFITPVGDYIYQYDVDKLLGLVENNNVAKEVFNIDEVFIDPKTEFNADKINDKRLPIVVRTFGERISFICVDGNKRLTAQMNINKISNFKAYILTPEYSKHFFFTSIDRAFYDLHVEIQILGVSKMMNLSDNDLLKMIKMRDISNSK
ncbi:MULTISPECIES: hypothetical protein [Bacillus]|uniref:hypothetical protein n=1 Tax=Bacillus TaxID=1386 RepID=UPI0011A11F9A|nr:MULTISPECIES: hypothetical protein [Bacillus]NOL36740.1 hypothetical protein [Bacillus safensis]